MRTNNKRRNILRRYGCLVMTLLGIGGIVNAQTLQTSENDTIVKLEDVVVSSLKVEKKVAEAPVSITIVDAMKYQKKPSFTVADGLKDEPGLFMGGDGVWATNINVRGMGENRLVTLVDGNRIETATDLTASLSMIDVNDIERVEVIKGAQSVLYGSGAMGGIVNVITKDGHFGDKYYINGSVMGAYSSVNNSNNEYISVMTGDKRWYVKLNAGYSKAYDIKTPKGILSNSGYESNNIALRAGVKLADNHIIKVNFQRNWATNVGIPGGSAFPASGIAKYKDIGRTLLNTNYEITDITDKFKSLKFTLFVQDIIRNVEMQPNQITRKELPNGNIQVTAPQLFEPKGTHLTYGGQAQGRWQLNSNNTLIAGVDVWRRDITSKRTKYIDVTIKKPDGTIVKTNKVERGESPLPNASFTSAGIFIQDEMNLLNDKLNLTIGGRIDGIFVQNEECHDVDYIITNDEINSQPAGQRITFEKGSKSDISWSANIGAIYKLTNTLDIVLNAARSYRAPSLEERFKYIDLTSKVRLGNVNLKAEDGLSFDLGLRFWGDNITVQTSAFLTKINNMIVERDGQFIYNTTDGTTDTLPALVLDNASKALLYGLDLDFNYRICNALEAFASGTYVMGLETSTDKYLPNIPPMNGKVGLAYTYRKIGSVALNLTAVADKRLIAQGEKTTDAYARLDLSLNTKVFQFGQIGLQLFGGIDNITNEEYVNFFSTNRNDINCEPGRNIYIKGRISF
ncbi:MAG: TonB-dependent receptor [Candidatus Limimorpha sp.]